VMGAANDSISGLQYATTAPAVQTAVPNAARPAGAKGVLTDWLEMYDYAGGARFRGFITHGIDDRSMFVFFDENVLGTDLKPGLMAILELCETQGIQCSNLVVCVDRQLDATDRNGLMRDLGWVGFEPVTLDEWSAGTRQISKRWLFLSMEA